MLGLTVKSFNVDSTVHIAEKDPMLDADQAARLLGVRKPTLYAYVSRGLLRSYGTSARRQGHRYLTSELTRLKARSNARAGHGAVAASALRFGDPVLDSAITAIGARGPVYRGHGAVDLAASGASFESVAELLWTGALPARPLEAFEPLPFPASRPQRALGSSTHRILWLARAVADAALADHHRAAPSQRAELLRARGLLAWLASSLHSRGASGSAPIARRVARSLGVQPSPANIKAIDAMLIVMADHELNASTFAARVVASTGADLYACLLAALAAASGPRHAAASLQVEALLEEVGGPRRARSVIERRLRRGEIIPGFGHALYPNGDPRAVYLMTEASGLAPRSEKLRTLGAISKAMQRSHDEMPNVDLALLAMCEAIGAPPGSASLVFVLGRTAGWIAHVMEQRTSPALLRPRARYVGASAIVPPGSA